MMNDKKGFSLVPAICPQCGAKVDVDPAKDAVICEYCNTPFSVEKAINNYNINKTTIINNNVRKSGVTSLFNYLEKKEENRMKIYEDLQKNLNKENDFQKEHHVAYTVLAITVLIAACVMLVFAIKFLKNYASDEDIRKAINNSVKTAEYIAY